MSRFYGDLQGGRGTATRQGTKSSGISGHLRGWDIGARVIVAPQGLNEAVDEVAILKTGGSSSSTTEGYIAGYSKTELTAGILKNLLDAAKAFTMHLREMESGKWLNNKAGEDLIKAINKTDDMFNRGS